MRVLLADDHSIIRAALRAVILDIDPAADVVEGSSFGDLQAAVDDTATPRPDLVILDLRMPGYCGHDQIGALAAALAPCPVAVFSMADDPREMRELLAHGVRAFIPKSTEHAVLGGVLRIVLAGGTYVPPELGMALANAAARGETEAVAAASEPRAPLAGLTRRQREVMELLGEGLSNAEICERLGLNLSTVKAHVSGVLRALGVDSRTQAALRIREMLGRQ